MARPITAAARRKLFAKEYVRNGGRTGKAAETAGYGSPSVRGSELMREPAVLELIREEVAKADWVDPRLIVRLHRQEMVSTLAGALEEIEQ
jgi:phage terminase small subunit